MPGRKSLTPTGKPSRRAASPNPAGRSSSAGRSRNKGQQIAVGIIVAIGFCVLLIGAIKAYEQYLIVKFWPAARGQVTSSQVTSMSNAGSPTRYQPEVEFRYRVRGMEYVSKTITNSDAADYPEAKRIANSYASGSWHVIRYDFFLWPVALTGLGLAFILIPLSTVIRLRAPSKRRDPSQGMRVVFGSAVYGILRHYLRRNAPDRAFQFGCAPITGHARGSCEAREDYAEDPPGIDPRKEVVRAPTNEG
jgi:hypothetical protein